MDLFRNWMIAGAFCLLPFSLSAKKAPATDVQEVLTGIYLMNLYDLDINAYSFYADFYLWFKWKGDRDPMNIEFVNSVEKWGYTVEPFQEEPKLLEDGYWYNGMRIEGRFYHSFELGRFPLDRHQLEIRIENVEHPIDSLIYVPAVSSRLIREDFRLPGWRVRGAVMQAHANFYNTDFGDSSAPASTFSNFTFKLDISRPLSYFLLKLLLPLLVVMTASLGALFIHPVFLETRISLPIGGLLSSVFLQQSYSSALPDVGYMVLMDKIYLLSYGFIALLLLRVILSGNRLRGQDAHPAGEQLKRRDRRLGILFFLMYLAGVLALVLVH